MHTVVLALVLPLMSKRELFPPTTEWRQELNQTLTQQAWLGPYGIFAPRSVCLRLKSQFRKPKGSCAYFRLGIP